VCDAVELCTGSSIACPDDLLQTSAIICRGTAGSCDVVERCTGIATDCPADVVAASTTVCRTSAGSCDVVENCTGASPTCPADAVLDTTTVCRAAIDATCDFTEFCTGTAGTCPPNSVETQGTACTDDSEVCTTDVCNGAGACAHNANTLPCTDDLYCTGADTCAGGTCSAHAGNPCLTGTNCIEASDTCDPCAALTLPATQSCFVGRSCTVSVGLAAGGLSVGDVQTELVGDPASTCSTSCTVGTAASNGTCSIDETCSLLVADVTPPPTNFSDGEIARVNVLCSSAGSGTLCIGDTTLAAADSSPVPVCTAAECADYSCAACEPGDANTTPGIDAGDPIAVVHCVVGDANPLFDCTCGGDCNCQNGTDVADAICAVKRLVGTFSPDTCAGAGPSSAQDVAAFVAVRELAATEDADRSVVRLKGEEAGEVAGLHVTLDTGTGAEQVRLSRRLVKRGFQIHQIVTDGHAGVVVTPGLPDESIGKGPVLRIRHHGGNVQVGSTEYGSTEGLSLRGQDQAPQDQPQEEGPAGDGTE